MLHKSFKPAKCKTSLKLANSRIKLMKNKKGVQMNQMKRELAQLLDSGQDRTARIRVEHLIREEKMVAAYDLIEIYCELIAARLPIIESQKNCPIDLKEAITSVIFASPRCADIPELLDVKKHFTAKYGKEFVTSALELRPNCGVGRMLVEKLSAIAPDGQTKVKILNAIAEEHNIKWDSQSFEEKDSKPADDLLNGPSTFEKASELHAETPKIQVPNVQATSSHDEHVRPSNFTEENTRSSLNNQNFSSTEPDGKGDERMKVRHSFTRDDDAPEYNKENGVHWASSPDHLDLPQKPFHHSNNFDSPCVSDSGSDILSKREVIQKLRQQLKARDGMILEMQDQIAELQNSLRLELSIKIKELQQRLDSQLPNFL